MNTNPNFLSLTLLALPGITLFLALRILYGHRRAADRVSKMLSIAAWLMVITACFGLIIGAASVAAIVIIPVFLGVLLAVYLRYRRGEDRALLLAFGVAAEEGIPLVEMAEAEAIEQGGGRPARVWEALKQGRTPLAALRRGGCLVPAGARAAFSLAESTGNLGSLLRRALEPLRAHETALNAAIQRIMFWVAVTLVWAGIANFMLVTIVPVIARTIDEFGIRPSPFFSVLIRSPLVSLLTSTPLKLLIAIFLMALAAQQIGITLPAIPPIPLLRRRYDSAVVLHALAAGVQSAVPLPEMFRVLAGSYNFKPIARKLTRVAAAVEKGNDPWDAMRREKLLTKNEAAALTSAARVGDPTFVLKELSEGILRRLEFRLHLATAVIQPVGLICGGLLTLMMVVWTFVPLMALIHGLSK